LSRQLKGYVPVDVKGGEGKELFSKRRRSMVVKNSFLSER